MAFKITLYNSPLEDISQYNIRLQEKLSNNKKRVMKIILFK